MAPRIDQEEEFPWDNIKKIGEMGLMGMTIDPKYGGSGGSYIDLVIVAEELARGCASTSLIYIASLSLGCQTLYSFGTEEQKAKYVTPLARGQKLAAFGLSEPGSGSDIASLRTSAIAHDGHYFLNGSKTFITNGDVADTLVIFATVDRSLGSKGLTAFIVEKGTEGFSSRNEKGKLGMRGSTTAELFFEDCRLPLENRLDEEGSGMRIALSIIDGSRIAVAAQAVGIAHAALEAALAYAQQRHQFGQPIAEFQAIQWMLADMATRISAARLLAYKAADLKAQGLPFSRESAMAKVFASEVANYAASKAIQIHGGYGYFKETPVERYFRDAKVTEIYEGTSEIQRLVIARDLLNRGL
jgi:alkylation response protein AidB-like acyl-CoA dehydrogenase